MWVRVSCLVACAAVVVLWSVRPLVDSSEELSDVVAGVLGADVTDSRPLRRVAFGSCNKQYAPQPLWKDVVKFAPDLWLWTGDAVYANNTRVRSLRRAVARQRNREDYRELLATSAAVDGVWDDHDLGINDGGRSSDALAQRRAAFLELFAPEPARAERAAAARGGLWRSRAHGVGSDREVRVLLLDTRSRRDDHAVPSVGAACRGVPVLGKLTPLLAAFTRLVSDVVPLLRRDGDVLGAEQWRWLDAQLAAAREAKFVVIVSSIQVGTSNPAFESWRHFPKAKAKLLSLLRRHRVRGLVFLSGDVHHAEVIAPHPVRAAEKGDDDDGDDDVPEHCGEFVELTSSGLTHTIATKGLTRLLYPPLIRLFRRHRQRPEDYSTEVNWGTLEFEFDASPTPLLRVSARRQGGDVLISTHVRSCPFDPKSLPD